MSIRRSVGTPVQSRLKRFHLMLQANVEKGIFTFLGFRVMADIIGNFEDRPHTKCSLKNPES